MRRAGIPRLILLVLTLWGVMSLLPGVSDAGHDAGNDCYVCHTLKGGDVQIE